MRRYHADRAVAPLPVTPIKPKTVKLTPIAVATKLVNMTTASELLASEKGITMSVCTIRTRCREGKWQKGYHWSKPGKSYVINMQAVYESIAAGSL